MRAWLIAGALIVLLIGAYAVYAFKAGEGESAPAPASAMASASLISVKDVYSKGAHAISGMVLAPDACTSITATVATSTGSDGLYLATPADTGLCLELPTPVSFSASVSGDATTSTAVYLNGALVTTTKPVAAPPPPAAKKK